MLLLIIIFGIIGVICPSTARSQDIERIKLAIEFIKQTCLRGEDIEVIGKGDAGVILRKKGVGGEINFSYKDIPGFARDAKEETRASQNDKIRDCMERRIDKVLDALLGPQKESSISQPQKTPPSSSSLTKIKPDGVNGSARWVGKEPKNAFDGNLHTLWGVQWHKARGASLEILFRAPKTFYGLRLYTPPGVSAYRMTEATLFADNGSQRKLTFRGLEEWEEVNFEPLQATTLKFEVNELRKGASGFLEVNEIELLGK
jgi:hypothetical protein